MKEDCSGFVVGSPTVQGFMVHFVDLLDLRISLKYEKIQRI